MVNNIEKQIRDFHDRLASDRHHRYRSWEHCYTHFHGSTVAEDTETAALHLAFYLASWGMYRGSSDLLWKDYKIHQPIVSRILAPEYRNLWDLQFNDPGCDKAAADLIVSLSKDIATIYQEQITTVNGAPTRFQPTDTLTTKVLLGTIGCSPACDRYFILGWRHTDLPYSRFGAGFLRRAFSFCREHREAFQQAQDDITKAGGIRYPVMKLVDMYFWEIGSKIPPEAETESATSQA